MGVILAPVLLTLACAWTGWSRPEGCPVVPVASAQLPDGMELRARVNLRVRDRAVGLEVFARATSGELVVIGLSRFGTRLFAVRQRDRVLSVEGAASREIRRLALSVLDALHRAYWIRPPASPGADGPSWDWEGERVTESASGDHRRRTFERGRPESASVGVTIDYSTRAGSGMESAVGIHNPWCGYEAVLVALDPRPAASDAEPDAEPPRLEPAGADG